LSTGAIFALLAVGLIVWILVVRQLTAKSWESRGKAGDVGEIDVAPEKLGLWMFLAVVASLFILFMSAFSIRMHHGDDWTPIPVPPVLWVNTALLIFASIALQSARDAVKKTQLRALKFLLVAAGLFTFAFLAGQLAAWQQLRASGQFISSGPAIAFFYMLTAVHGLHLLGGLWVWGKTLGRLVRGAALSAVRLSVELCAVYWHFLLLVWLILFALLSSS
jgi:cytochrome c oxidase subunit III